MKFVTALVALLSSVAVNAGMHHVPVTLNEVPADSEMGMRLLSQARRVEDWGGNYQYGNGQNGQQQNYEELFEHTWVSGYSIKFQGCHHISQWNKEADDENDVRIVTKRLARFRLCPSGFCTNGQTAGCSSGYADYVVDLNTFLETYFEHKNAGQNAQQEYYQEQQEYYQEQQQQYQDQYGNQYNNGQQQQQQQQVQGYNYNEEMVQNYMGCAQANFGRRQLDQNYNNNGYNFYIGPYCASQGGEIFLGLFLDDSCTTFADNNGGQDTYLSRAGGYLPYGSESIVDFDCISCKENEGNYQWDNAQAENQNYYYYNDMQDMDDVSDVCETIYNRAGKCEANLPQGTAFEPNNSACNYIEGIKIVRNDGTVTTAQAKATKSAKAIMTTLSLAFVALAAYVYFLKTKLERGTVNLGEE